MESNEKKDDREKVSKRERANWKLQTKRRNWVTIKEVKPRTEKRRGRGKEIILSNGKEREERHGERKAGVRRARRE